MRVANALPPGTAIDRYIFEDVVGAGGFGVTYRGHHALTGQAVAIKEFLPTRIVVRGADRRGISPVSPSLRAEFDRLLKGFVREARTLAALRHRNIVPVLDFFYANGTAYMPMVFLNGRSLAEARGSDPPDEPAIRALADALLDGLAAVHEAGFLHSDVKPANVIVTDIGTPVLVDFGAARQFVGEATDSLDLVLTRGFAPFEQYLPNGRRGPWTDIYALGATLYWYITGNVPSAAPDRIDALRNGRSDPVAALVADDQLRLAPGIRAAVDAALAVDEAARPASAAAMRALLNPAGAVLTPTHPREQAAAVRIDAAGTLLPGQQIGRYEITQRLGLQMLGHRYEARTPVGNEKLVVQEFCPPALAIRDHATGAVRATTREKEKLFARALDHLVTGARTLRHISASTNVLRVVETVLAHGTAYVVMPDISAEPLRHVIDRRIRLDPESARRIGLGVSQALVVGHDAGLLHHHIDPDNVLVDGGGEAVLAGLGFPAAHHLGVRLPRLSAFEPPEIGDRKQDAGPAADIYSVGAVLHFCLAGEAPPVALGRHFEVSRGRADTYVPLAKRLAGRAPHGLLAAVDAALEIRADARPASAADLRRLLSESGGTTGVRRFVGVLGVDIVGYTRLVAADQSGALRAVKDFRESVLQPCVAANGGRVFKTMGDGFLAEFPDAATAVAAAVALQDGVVGRAFGPNETSLTLRIGVHEGEVVDVAGDLFGGTVIVAARLVGAAQPRGVLISAAAWSGARAQPPRPVVDRGALNLKNLPEPLQALEMLWTTPP
jgi:serine/threonine protein kinase